ncbi:MAG: YheC/YheD family protein, partial [Candidatus Saccharimonadales bacterium]
ELRIYAIRGTVYPIAAVRQSKTHHQKTRVTDIRQLTRDEIDFSTKIHARISSIDLLGIDIARTVDGKLHLIEVNRSPGFAAFTALTNVNLSGLLYSAIEAQLPTMSSTN